MADLKKADLIGADLKGDNLQNAKLKETYLLRTDFEKDIFGEQNFEEASRGENSLEEDMKFAIDQLSKVKTLYNAELDAKFKEPLKKKYPALFSTPFHIGKDLGGARYEGKDLKEHNFKETNLEGAHFERAILNWADFEGANLKSADLQEADLKGANFENADLQGAKNLTVEQLSRVRSLLDAKLDYELLLQLRDKSSALFEAPDKKFEEPPEEDKYPRLSSILHMEEKII